MRIKLVNCDGKLKAMGIDMEAVGSYERLSDELLKRLSYSSLEYAYPPVDTIILDVEEGTEIPDLSDFGELMPYDYFMG